MAGLVLGLFFALRDWLGLGRKKSVLLVLALGLGVLAGGGDHSGSTGPGQPDPDPGSAGAGWGLPPGGEQHQYGVGSVSHRPGPVRSSERKPAGEGPCPLPERFCFPPANPLGKRGIDPVPEAKTGIKSRLCTNHAGSVERSGVIFCFWPCLMGIFPEKTRLFTGLSPFDPGLVESEFLTFSGQTTFALKMPYFPAGAGKPSLRSPLRGAFDLIRGGLCPLELPPLCLLTCQYTFLQGKQRLPQKFF